jgi:hypothetical protein
MLQRGEKTRILKHGRREWRVEFVQALGTDIVWQDASLPPPFQREFNSRGNWAWNDTDGIIVVRGWALAPTFAKALKLAAIATAHRVKWNAVPVDHLARFSRKGVPVMQGSPDIRARQ